ncbi:hypothetical protein CDL12_18753 [Handroanthus impetiginosus]|uniref:Reverse transcriptase RNase H-like domain-containing protein n=1 Tax=Handroanthus impetiginosus TaxID=429701 RepID=A0A2G9GTQ5_9LAMI|nr:hypothetical protein CDL12_18753 [Handroanthus impetiginosus]
MKLYAPFDRDKGCENAFQSIKMYLSNPPIMGAPVPRRPLILYIAEQKKKKDRALYYLSRTLMENELKYSLIEKICLAPFYSIKKLKYYFEAYPILLISRVDPVKFVMSWLVLSGILAKWSIIFNQYEITYVLQKAVKGQALANFPADHPLLAE